MTATFLLQLPMVTPMHDKPLELWYWIIPGDAYPFKRHKSTWLMTEEEAWRRYGSDAQKVEDSLEIRVVGKQSTAPVYKPYQPAHHDKL